MTPLNLQLPLLFETFRIPEDFFLGLDYDPVCRILAQFNNARIGLHADKTLFDGFRSSKKTLFFKNDKFQISEEGSLPNLAAKVSALFCTQNCLIAYSEELRSFFANFNDTWTHFSFKKAPIEGSVFSDISDSCFYSFYCENEGMLSLLTLREELCEYALNPPIKIGTSSTHFCDGKFFAVAQGVDIWVTQLSTKWDLLFEVEGCHPNSITAMTINPESKILYFACTVTENERASFYMAGVQLNVLKEGEEKAALLSGIRLDHAIYKFANADTDVLCLCAEKSGTVDEESFPEPRPFVGKMIRFEFNPYKNMIATLSEGNWFYL